MQVSSVNVSPETANHMIVSLNGIIQAPGSSYTVSGSTITFASNLVTGDVINFIHILGSVLDLGTPSDDTVATSSLKANSVTAAKLNADIISGTTALASEPADTDEFLVSDAGVLKRIDYSLIKGGGDFVKLAGGNNITSDSNLYGYYTSDYINYKWIFNGVTSSGNSILHIRLYKSSGVISSSNYHYAVGMNYKTSSSHQWTTAAGGWNDNKFALSYNIVSSSAGLGSTLVVDVYDPQSSNKKNIGWLHWHETHDGATYAKDFGDGISADTDAHTGISLISSSGNFGAEHWSLYGMKV